MASVKLGTLVIRTIAKPISEQLKNYAKSNQRFRGFCIGLAQNLWRAEIRLRETLLGEVHGVVRPLNDAKAIQNGANFLAEGFLFSVAASLIIAETWRTSRSQSKRRDDVDDKLEEMEERLNRLTGMIEALSEHVGNVETNLQIEAARNEELSRVLLRVVDIGLRGGWAEFEDHPIQLPHLELDRLKPSFSTSTKLLPHVEATSSHKNMTNGAKEESDSGSGAKGTRS
ncbi:hypothetical protein M408DRAFT_327763 [Serendipita vermifera MAFF 305830]|uniref:OPA3-domain-containing protein n=1 Tax=Serendipita vermifera MAFF 305830 TaxID=933852 RepID=A0A0C3B1Q9_SERVB|nr:hypothetical protein M408DRAFT_327763 [Serendipita vermifera MAFF 305830]